MSQIIRDKAIDFMRYQRYAEAIPLFSELINDDPNDWSLHYMIGQCYRFTEQLPKAINALTKATDLNDKESQSFHALGIVLQISDQYEQAIEKLKIAITIDPNLITGYNSIGLTYKKLNNYQKAIDWYTKAADSLMNTIHNQLVVNRDKCYKEEIAPDGGKILVALPYLMEETYKLLHMNPTYSIIKNNIGVCCIELGEKELAKEHFKESIEFIPEGYNYPDPIINLKIMTE